MNFLDLFRKQIKPVQKPSEEKPAQKLTASERERELVKITTDDHMQLLTGFPFIWDKKLKKNLAQHSHAFSYMNISANNIDAVKNELKHINEQISIDLKKHNYLPQLQIPISSLVFEESKTQGYTRFICWPITITGKVSKYPLTLFFTTALAAGSNSTHGELIYGQDGTIKKAKIYFWRNGKGFFLYYQPSENGIVLSKIDQI